MKEKAAFGWLAVCVLAGWLLVERSVNVRLAAEAHSTLALAESSLGMLTESNKALNTCNNYFDQCISHMKTEEWLNRMTEATAVCIGGDDCIKTEEYHERPGN